MVITIFSNISYNISNEEDCLDVSRKVLLQIFVRLIECYTALHGIGSQRMDNIPGVVVCFIFQVNKRIKIFERLTRMEKNMSF